MIAVKAVDSKYIPVLFSSKDIYNRLLFGSQLTPFQFLGDSRFLSLSPTPHQLRLSFLVSVKDFLSFLPITK